MDNTTIKNDKTETNWFKKHKKAMCIGGGTALLVAAAIIAFALFRRKPSAKETEAVHDTLANASPEFIGDLIDSVTERKRPTEPVNVSQFIRKLPEGCHVSKEQLEIAESLGVEIPDGCTLVREYIKYKNSQDCA